jgi:hypothetical protein
MTPTSIHAVIDSLSFQFARTMPEIPHEYVVRSPDNEVAYVALFGAIMEYGVYENWAGRRKRYLYPGDGRKYWTMTTKLHESRVINRMKIEDDLERLRREELDRTSRAVQFFGGVPERRIKNMLGGVMLRQRDGGDTGSVVARRGR